MGKKGSDGDSPERIAACLKCPYPECRNCFRPPRKRPGGKRADKPAPRSISR